VAKLTGFRSPRGIACEASHYRTATGAEVNLVLEGDFGMIPVEIKLTSSVETNSLRSLATFIREYRCRLGVVINNDEQPRIYDRNLVGIPFAA